MAKEIRVFVIVSKKGKKPLDAGLPEKITKAVHDACGKDTRIEHLRIEFRANYADTQPPMS